MFFDYDSIVQLPKNKLVPDAATLDFWNTRNDRKRAAIIKERNRIKDMLGGLGVNAIESLRGNRLHLRGIGLDETELNILGIRSAGD